MNFSDSPIEVNTGSAVTSSELNTYISFFFFNLGSGELSVNGLITQKGKETGRDLSHPNVRADDWFNPV